MFTRSSVSKIALIGAVALAVGMPSIADAGLKKQLKKIIASPVGSILTGNPLPLNWKKSLSLTKPVVIKNGQSCQTFHIDSSYRDSPSSKIMLPTSKFVVTVTGKVNIGGGADVDSYNIVDSDVMYPATSSRPITYQPAQAGAPGLAIPSLGHDKVRFGILRPNYQEWDISTTSEGDSIPDLRKGMNTGGMQIGPNFLTMILQARVQGEHDNPLPASGAYAATAILEVCTA
jgi:hypothetical protein